MLSMVIVMISMSMASIRRIDEVLRENPDLKDPESPVTEVADGSIDFEHVNFSYKHGSGKNVLTDIDLHIHSGETIGVIGGTGSGKSSLVNLICRLYDVDQGAVRVGGVDVRNYDMETLRNQVAVVLQKNTLFSGTILEISAGEIRTPRSSNASRPARRPARTNSSIASPTATRRASSGAERTSPADRSSGCASRGRCSSGPRF